jgi:hypothetical protein
MYFLIVHKERGKLPKDKESSCKLGAIGDLLKDGILHISFNTTPTSSSSSGT